MILFGPSGLKLNKVQFQNNLLPQPFKQTQPSAHSLTRAQRTFSSDCPTYPHTSSLPAPQSLCAYPTMPTSPHSVSSPLQSLKALSSSMRMSSARMSSVITSAVSPTCVCKVALLHFGLMRLKSLTAPARSFCLGPSKLRIFCGTCPYPSAYGSNAILS